MAHLPLIYPFENCDFPQVIRGADLRHDHHGPKVPQWLNAPQGAFYGWIGMDVELGTGMLENILW